MTDLKRRAADEAPIGKVFCPLVPLCHFRKRRLRKICSNGQAQFTRQTGLRNITPLLHSALLDGLRVLAGSTRGGSGCVRAMATTGRHGFQKSPSRSPDCPRLLTGSSLKCDDQLPIVRDSLGLVCRDIVSLTVERIVQRRSVLRWIENLHVATHLLQVVRIQAAPRRCSCGA